MNTVGHVTVRRMFLLFLLHYMTSPRVPSDDMGIRQIIEKVSYTVALIAVCKLDRIMRIQK